MCEICKSEGIDYRFINGPQHVIVTHQLYKVFKNSTAPVKLCYIHGIELFMIGEKRFLKEHLSFARGLATRTKKQESSNSPFGF